MKPQFGQMLAAKAGMGGPPMPPQGGMPGQDPDDPKEDALLQQVATDVAQIKVMLGKLMGLEQQEGPEQGSPAMPQQA